MRIKKNKLNSPFFSSSEEEVAPSQSHTHTLTRSLLTPSSFFPYLSIHPPNDIRETNTTMAQGGGGQLSRTGSDEVINLDFSTFFFLFCYSCSKKCPSLSFPLSFPPLLLDTLQAMTRLVLFPLSSSPSPPPSLPYARREKEERKKGSFLLVLLSSFSSTTVELRYSEVFVESMQFTISMLLLF